VAASVVDTAAHTHTVRHTVRPAVAVNGLLAHLATTGVTVVTTATKARVTDTAVAVHPPLLEGGEVVPLATKLVLTTTSQGVSTRALNIVPVTSAGATVDTVELLVVRVAATAHVTVEATVAETHVAEPGIVAVRNGGLEGRVLVEVTVMVVDTTTSRDVATGQTGNGDTVAILVSRAGGTVHAREAALTVVAGHTARAETSVAAPVVALGHGLLECREAVEVAVVIVDTTTDHLVTTMETGTDDTSTVGGSSGGTARKARRAPVGPVVPAVHSPVHSLVRVHNLGVASVPGALGISLLLGHHLDVRELLGRLEELERLKTHAVVGEARVVAVLEETLATEVVVLVHVSMAVTMDTNGADVIVLETTTAQVVQVVGTRVERGGLTPIVAVLVHSDGTTLLGHQGGGHLIVPGDVLLVAALLALPPAATLVAADRLAGLHLTLLTSAIVVDVETVKLGLHAAIRTLSVGTIALDLLLHGVDAGLAIALDAETPSLTRLLGTLEAGAASGILGTTLTSNTNLTGTLSLADPGHVRLAATLSHLESLSTLLPDLLDTLVPPLDTLVVLAPALVDTLDVLGMTLAAAGSEGSTTLRSTGTALVAQLVESTTSLSTSLSPGLTDRLGTLGVTLATAGGSLAAVGSVLLVAALEGLHAAHVTSPAGLHVSDPLDATLKVLLGRAATHGAATHIAALTTAALNLLQVTVAGNAPVGRRLLKLLQSLFGVACSGLQALLVRNGSSPVLVVTETMASLATLGREPVITEESETTLGKLGSLSC